MGAVPQHLRRTARLHHVSLGDKRPCLCRRVSPSNLVPRQMVLAALWSNNTNELSERIRRDLLGRRLLGPRRRWRLRLRPRPCGRSSSTPFALLTLSLPSHSRGSVGTTLLLLCLQPRSKHLLKTSIRFEFFALTLNTLSHSNYTDFYYPFLLL